MIYTDEILMAAHHHAANHRGEIETSTLCRCFYCLDTFEPKAIERWLNEGSGTAICPSCQIDWVIGDRSGYPVDRADFAAAMHERWFERAYPCGTLVQPDQYNLQEQPEPFQIERGEWSPEDLAAIQEGFDQLDRGEGVSQDIVEREIDDLLRS